MVVAGSVCQMFRSDKIKENLIRESLDSISVTLYIHICIWII